MFLKLFIVLLIIFLVSLVLCGWRFLKLIAGPREFEPDFNTFKFFILFGIVFNISGIVLLALVILRYFGYIQ